MTETPDLARELLDLQVAFDWPDQAPEYELVDTWERARSGSEFHRLTGVPQGPDVVFKTVEGWAPGDASAMFETMTDLADVIDRANLGRAHAIRPLAWGSDPVGLVMPYVEGADVVSILRTPDTANWSQRITDSMESAGSILAAYHGAHSMPVTEVDEAAQLAARFRIDRTFDPGRESAISFGDFGPGNLHLTPDDTLYLLDPPVAPNRARIHRDLGNFLFELRRQLAGRGFTASSPVPGHFEPLSTAFLRGYEEQRDGPPFDSEDRALIALFELRRSAGMARKRFPGRPGDALWFARAALARRREVLEAQSG